MTSSEDASALEPALVGAVSGIFCAYRYQNVAITFWFGPATMESLVVFERGANDNAQLHPQGFSLINIMVPGGRSLPSAEVRAKFAQIAAEHAQRTAAVAVLIPGTGFWASAMRGMITALSMMSPRDYELQTFGNFPQMIEWLVPVHARRTSVAIEPRELLRALQTAEARALETRASHDVGAPPREQ